MTTIVTVIALSFTSGVCFGILLCALIRVAHVCPEPTPPAEAKIRSMPTRVAREGKGGWAA